MAAIPPVIFSGSARDAVVSLMAAHLGQPPEALVGPVVCDGSGVFSLLAGEYVLVLDTVEETCLRVCHADKDREPERWFFGSRLDGAPA